MSTTPSTRACNHVLARWSEHHRTEERRGKSLAHDGVGDGSDAGVADLDYRPTSVDRGRSAIGCSDAGGGPTTGRRRAAACGACMVAVW
jgi:hypothetical protein